MSLHHFYRVFRKGWFHKSTRRYVLNYLVKNGWKCIPNHEIIFILIFNDSSPTHLHLLSFWPSKNHSSPPLKPTPPLRFCMIFTLPTGFGSAYIWQKISGPQAMVIDMLLPQLWQIHCTKQVFCFALRLGTCCAQLCDLHWVVLILLLPAPNLAGRFAFL